jgi:ribonuclease P protein component
MLSKKYRLPKEKFQYIYKNGKKIRGRYGMLVFVKDSTLKNPKLGIVVSKKVGNAVKRHRMTRLVRNIFTETVKENLLDSSPYFLQYVAFEFCDSFGDLKEEFSKQTKEALEK